MGETGSGVGVINKSNVCLVSNGLQMTSAVEQSSAGNNKHQVKRLCLSEKSG